MPYQREAEIVLAMWRQVERLLRETPPESEDAARLIEEWALLRAEYNRLID